VSVAALLLPFIVALPPGAVAPPPGSVPPAARVSVLDRELGLVSVRLPRRAVAVSLRRLRAAPGVRYVERDLPIQLAAGGAGCETLGLGARPDPRWRAAIHLSRRSAAGVLIGIADSGVDDDRLAPREAPLLFLGPGSRTRPQDAFGHGTAVGSMLVANRPDIGVVGLVPDATLLSARIVRPGPCSSKVLAHGLVAALGWLRREGAQVVNVSATAPSSRALVDSLRALELSGSLVVAAVGNGGKIAGQDLFPASQPGVLGVGALAPASSTQVWPGSTSGPQVDLVAPAAGVKVLSVKSTAEFVYTPEGTSFSSPLVTAAAAMVWATHRDWNAAEVANALVRSATPLPKGHAPSRIWGSGRLNVSLALRTARMPDPHEPNDWGAAARAQRPLRPGVVVVASLGYAGDAVDAYPIVVPAGGKARARLRRGARGLTMRVLPFRASDAAITAVAGKQPHGSQITLPPGRHLLVVARSQDAGPYTLALSRR
jgi:Subtilase family